MTTASSATDDRLRRTGAALAGIAALTVAEILVAGNVFGGWFGPARLPVLVALLLAKLSVLLLLVLGARPRHEATRLVLLAMGLAAGFAIVLMFEAAFQVCPR